VNSSVRWSETHSCGGGE